MYSIKISIIYFVSFNIIVQIQSLVQLPVFENNSIAIAETVIRNTVNSLFATLNIQEIKKRPAIGQYSTIHNLFASITLTDCENHKKIARLSTVNNIDNNTQHFIAQINEVLNEGDKIKEANANDSNIYVTTYIERFIQKLRYLKGVYVSKNNTKINEDVLKFLKKNKNTFINYTGHKVYNKTIKGSKDKNVLDDIGVWQSSGRRIYNGIRTNVKRFPFMASIHFFSRFQCAGSIIKNDLVITSASCMQVAWNNRFFRENPSFVKVKVGSNVYQKGGDDLPVQEVYFHPQYEPATLSHNLAILRLGRLLKFRRKAKRIKKINFDKNPVPLSLNTYITVVGWGAQTRENKIYNLFTNKLSYANLDFYPLKLCQEHYSEDYVTKKNFCAGFFSKGGGACSHDAGGPGIVGSILTGVISFGSPDCGRRDSPTVFTKLGFYTDWIESIFEKKVPRYNHPTTTMATTRSTRWFDMIARERTKTTKLSIQPLEIPEGDNLLRVAKDEQFKDFLSAMFSSEEVGVFLKENKESKNKKTPISRLEKLDSAMTATVISDRDSSKVTTLKPVDDLSSSSAEDLIESPRNISEVHPPVEVILKNQLKPSKKEANKNLTSKVKPSNRTAANSFEEDIMDLINNLEIDNLLSSVDKNEETVQNNNESKKGESTSKEKELLSSGIVQTNEDDNKDNAVSEKTVLRYLLNSDSDDDNESGMSIPAGKFEDLTFREGRNADTSDTENEVVLSESALLDLISIAIKKEGYEKIKENRYLL